MAEVRHDGMHAVQGVYYFSTEESEAFAVTHGYTEFNASILDLQGNVVVSANLGGETPASLLADVISDGQHLWWTDYRNERLFVSDFNLKIKHSVQLPEGIGTIVGITYVPEIDAVLLQRRQEPAKFVTIGVTPPFEIREIPIPFGNSDQYDVTYADGCIFFVERSSGRILMSNVNEIADGEISEQIVADQLQRPQHLAVVDQKLFIIETGGYRLSVLDFASGTRTLYPLPSKRIKRGLTVTPDHKVWVTGFFDPDDDISEANTGLTGLSLDH